LSQSVNSTRAAIPFGRPNISDEDRQAVLHVLEGHILTHGPVCGEFEDGFAAFMGADAHCVSVSSGMAALHLAYLQFGIGPGDEVIVPAMTHVATVHAVEMVGATPVFVDAEPATGNMTAESIQRAITPQTRAVSVVHFQGIPCDMPAIMQVASDAGLRVIEDCALAVGGRIDGRHVGLFGDASCYSFYPVKHLTCGEGGMFATRHPEVADEVRRRRAFGVDRSHNERSVPGMYDVPGLGLNYRMSEMQAALGKSQLTRLDAALQHRAETFSVLKQGFSGLPDTRVLDSTCQSRVNAHYGLTLVLEGRLRPHRNQAIAALKQRGIGTSVYYPHPVPRLLYYRDRYGYQPGAYPVAEGIADASIALPVAPHIDADDAARIVDEVSIVLKELAHE